ncbi:RNA polymerase sigma factor [Pleionea litopenaei]|uniref:RNA polymerase sigma factor n=1 Tax=Pleionea litopenaei TaxID=3070815 RepID=A0AA51RV69_9GAMM|nr:RNA polymerase sigma factor [Pleionea sp. HL-JVS1]WMS88170.1 RNA polymerase sigma factor [Pleionea sp. HL-JVS1]
MTNLTLTSTIDAIYNESQISSRRDILDNRTALDSFLKSVERRAFHIACFSTQNTDDALELVQESMLKLVEKYANLDEDQWRPLFYRILNSKINDWFRKQKVRRRWLGWLPRSKNSDDEAAESDPINEAPDPRGHSPEQLVNTQDVVLSLENQLQNLSERQRQAFLLRAWEGLSVEQTAEAMNCSQGSVKTHYSRAVHALRDYLREYQ